ncbi:hypothetical protein [Roseovarius indicus]|uniref:Uncharacterized protein n=1 Tax=Roseovarius indicus TaxID=540747 RepID=A0A5P3A812_9RHOB|nr:hypothetical protein [Roseovarius indicus]QEW24843.1 hypothetical protein RIdsm_00627 [Roseovarius indicus]SFE50317.1 hypothetical protein SAMN04488031_11159 [Roseovarius indicus]
MQINRHIGHKPNMSVLGDELASLRGNCIGCTGCKGPCAALLEALALPGYVLKGGEA